MQSCKIIEQELFLPQKYDQLEIVVDGKAGAGAFFTSGYNGQYNLNVCMQFTLDKNDQDKITSMFSHP